MDIWLTFAFISNGEVKNIACYLYTGYGPANEHAKIFCEDENAFAVDVTHIPTQIGDEFDNGKFYRIINDERVEIEPLPTVNDIVAANAAAIESANAAIDDIIIAITPQLEA